MAAALVGVALSYLFLVLFERIGLGLVMLTALFGLTVADVVDWRLRHARPVKRRP